MIQTAELHQFFVVAFFDDAAILENDDEIGIAHGAEAMGNDECGAAVHDGAEVLLDAALRFGVEGAGGFVEYEDRRIVVEGTGNGDALALTSRDRETGFPDLGFVAKR